ncbi:MAG: UDP-N-acetylmuramate--L-alanine ligase [Candidatus Colwellbacteria bacterium]|nr:UDP-N-acetylmuramate--L-alanine ligase [Candidatus Colwellbacteria bacterium]
MKIHFIGIGGIGVSALARLFLSEGNEVSGSDLAGSKLIEELQSEGIKIFVGEPSGENIPVGTEKVIYTVAVGEDNPEFQKAKELEIKLQTYPQALGELSKNYFTLAITGSHGKSTSTSMLALMMIEARLDPTVIVGTKLVEFGGSNFRKGKGKYLVIEADDFNKSFWNYTPQIAVVTNVDAEHLDTYGDIDGVVKGFNQYLKQLPGTSNAILNKEDEHTPEIEKDVKAKICYFEEPIEKWPLQIPGKFNQLNAEAAWLAAQMVGVTKEQAIEAVSRYKGAWRRMEKLIPIENRFGDTIFFSDYAHHPTEVKATLEALKGEYPERTLTVIFQPHQVRRLTELFKEFTGSFDSADKVVLMPVYKVAGRDPDNGKTSEELCQALMDKGMDKVSMTGSIHETLDELGEGVVVFMGAGSIDQQVREYFRSELLPE